MVDQNESIDKLMEIKRELGITSFLVTDLPLEKKLSMDDDGFDSFFKEDH